MLSKLEEIKLLSQCALVEAYQPRLRRFLLNLTMGDEDLTDDLAQETFIKAYMGIRSFKGISRFSTWLYRIAYNEFYSHKRRIQECRISQLPEAKQEVSERATTSTDARMDARAAMSALNTVERTVVTLFYIDDLPIKKIAHITSLPEGSVKSILFRSKEKMRNSIKSQY